MPRRQRRRSDPLTRGRGSPPLSHPPGAAPRDFFPAEYLFQEQDRRAIGINDLFKRAPDEAVQPRLRVYEPPLLKAGRRPFVGTPSDSALRSLWSAYHVNRRFWRDPVRWVWRSLYSKLSAKLQMSKKVKACVDRKQRREVLFARRKVGFAGSSPGRRSKYTRKLYRRTSYSRYACV